MAQAAPKFKWDNVRPATPWPKRRGRPTRAPDVMPGMSWAFSHRTMAEIDQTTNEEG